MVVGVYGVRVVGLGIGTVVVSGIVVDVVVLILVDTSISYSFFVL